MTEGLRESYTFILLYSLFRFKSGFFDILLRVAGLSTQDFGFKESFLSFINLMRALDGFCFIIASAEFKALRIHKTSVNSFSS